MKRQKVAAIVAKVTAAQDESETPIETINLIQYIANMEMVLQYNPPRNNPRYADDPVDVWRYYMRTFGAGLGGFNRAEVEDWIKTLYSRWFVRGEFHSQMPNVDNHRFIGWIYDAMNEARSRKGTTDETVDGGGN